MKADLPLDERRRMEAESEREIRDALVRRHFAVTEEQRAIHAALLHHALTDGARAFAELSGEVISSTVPTEGAAQAIVPPAGRSVDNLRAALGLP